MPHDIHQMMFVGKEPWHSLGTPLPTNGSYEEIVHAAGFYTAGLAPVTWTVSLKYQLLR